MTLSVHPLLSLIKDNANGLKLLLKNYIDFTVDNQFDQLKNSIVQMIATGQIGPKCNDSASTYTQTEFPSGQLIADPEDLPNLHHSNDQLTITPEQLTLPSSSLVSAIIPSTQIKQECVDYCSDAPNEQLNNVVIEVNDGQNGQAPTDEVKEEFYDDDDEDEGEYMSYAECEDCVNGICQLNQSHLVRENDNTNNDAPNVTDNDHLENIVLPLSVQERYSQDEFVDDAFDDDVENQLLPTSQQHSDHFTASIVSSTMYDSNDQLTTDQITLTPTNQLQTFTKQSNSDLTNLNEDDDFEDCLNEMRDDYETSEQIEIDQDNAESSRLVGMQRVDTTSPLNEQSQGNGQCPIETTQSNSQIECDEPVIQQSIPSTSGLRSSGRKRTQRKMFGDDDQSRCQVKSERKSLTQSSKTVKKVKHQEVDEIQEKEEEEEDNEVSNEVHQEETKLQIVTLKMNCTEPDCETILKSLEMWKEHLLTCHDQMPYKQLRDNARHNNRGQMDYPCTNCNVVCKSPYAIFKHWKYSHQPGKFKCSVCAFEANFRCEVHSHMQKSHRPSKFQCTFVGCQRVFTSECHLEEHQRIHMPQRAYACIWPKCQLTFKQHKTAIKHVRVQHFRLPPTIKEQHELNIIDERDPKVFVKVSGD